MTNRLLGKSNSRFRWLSAVIFTFFFFLIKLTSYLAAGDNDGGRATHHWRVLQLEFAAKSREMPFCINMDRTGAVVQCVTDVAWENWLLDTSMSAGRPAELLTQNMSKSSMQLRTSFVMPLVVDQTRCSKCVRRNNSNNFWLSSVHRMQARKGVNFPRRQVERQRETWEMLKSSLIDLFFASRCVCFAAVYYFFHFVFYLIKINFSSYHLLISAKRA